MSRTFLTPIKALGQHFLTDQNIAKKIVTELHPLPGETVLEIGPGEGALTRHLIATGAKIVAIDVDKRAIDALQQNELYQRSDRITFLCQDFLTIDIATLAENAKLSIVGNLPYNLTSPILFHIIDHHQCVRAAVVMMQREVAERLCAKPRTKAYGILSVILQLHASVKILFHVPPHVFHPKPNVESSVVHITFDSTKLHAINDYRFFRSLVRGTFGKRRKTLLNSMRMMNLDIASDSAALAPFLHRRPEELDVDGFIALSNVLSGSVGASR